MLIQKTEYDYRFDIDGLRAISVLAVIIFHVFPEILPSGYVGVDIFFVISGFVITNALLREHESRKLPLKSFYARRIRRIFPVLILVLLTSICFGWWVLFEDEFKQLGNHVFRAALFISNFALWREAGYFDKLAELKPLLHLWSLSIEEQFYIFWPVFFWLIIKLNWKAERWIAGILIASLVLNVFVSESDPTQDFYSPVTRFWEPLTGCLLAVVLPKISPKIEGQVQAGLGVSGALLILLSMMIGSYIKVYPSGWAVIPVFGAALFICSEGKFSPLQKIVTHPLLVWVGGISYALYLWHWPIFSFMRIILGETPPIGLKAMGLLITFTLAWVTTKYVEKFFRSTKQSGHKVLFLTLSMLVVGITGYLINWSDGVKNRAISNPAFIVYPGDIGHDVFLQASATQAAISATRGTPDIALLGDSHAQHLFLGLSQALPRHNIAVFGVAGLPIPTNPRLKPALEKICQNPSLKIVIIDAVWHTRIFDIAPGVDFEKELSATISQLVKAGKQVVLLDDIYQFDFDPQRCKYKRPLSGGSMCTAPRSLFEKQTDQYIGQLIAVKNNFNHVRLVRFGEIFCNQTVCSMLYDNQVVYRDNHHLNTIGTKIAGEKIASMMDLR